MIKILASLYLVLVSYFEKIKCFFLKRLFVKVGRNVSFLSTDLFTYHTISIGDDCHIGPGAKFISSDSTITIESKVMFGPNVTVLGGDHNITTIGEFMYDVKEKLPENDLPVTICEDVWVGANVTILKGVTISRGAVIAAGSVVTKSVPEYSIVAGVPGKVIKKRFSSEQIVLHEKKLYH